AVVGQVRVVGRPDHLPQVLVARADGQGGAAHRGDPRAGRRVVDGLHAVDETAAGVTAGEVDTDALDGRLLEHALVRGDRLGRRAGRVAGEDRAGHDVRQVVVHDPGDRVQHVVAPDGRRAGHVGDLRGRGHRVRGLDVHGELAAGLGRAGVGRDVRGELAR